MTWLLFIILLLVDNHIHEKTKKKNQGFKQKWKTTLELVESEWLRDIFLWRYFGFIVWKNWTNYIGDYNIGCCFLSRKNCKLRNWGFWKHNFAVNKSWFLTDCRTKAIFCERYVIFSFIFFFLFIIIYTEDLGSTFNVQEMHKNVFQIFQILIETIYDD